MAQGVEDSAPPTYSPAPPNQSKDFSISPRQTIRCGDVENAEECVQNGANIDMMEALMQAIRAGQPTLAVRIIKHIKEKDMLDVKDNYGYALTQAIRAGHVGVVQALLEKGANVHVEDNYGYALTLAIRGGYPALAIAIISRIREKYMLDVKDNYGYALTQAIRAGHVGVVQALLEKGANVHVEDNYGYALTLAIRGGYPAVAVAIISRIKEKYMLDVRDNYGYALTQAIRAGHVGVVQELIENGANVHVKDNYGYALTQAREAGSEILAAMLTVPNREQATDALTAPGSMTNLDSRDKALSIQTMQPETKPLLDPNFTLSENAHFRIIPNPPNQISEQRGKMGLLAYFWRLFCCGCS